jgi:hypothetical protein
MLVRPGGGAAGGGRTGKVLLGVVEEQHADVAAVIRVDDAGARVDEVLPRQA